MKKEKADDFGFVGTKIVSKGELFPPLECGQMDIGNAPYDEVVKTIEDNKLKTLLKRTKCYQPNILGPVTLYYKWFNKRFVAEARSTRFDSLEDIEKYLSKNRPLIYTIAHVAPFDKWVLRTYSTNDEIVSFNKFDKIYNNIVFKFIKIKNGLKK